MRTGGSYVKGDSLVASFVWLMPNAFSTKGTTVEQGDFGIRVLEGTKLSAKQLTTAEDAVKKALKPVKGSRVFMRVFPDIPVCVKVSFD